MPVILGLEPCSSAKFRFIDILEMSKCFSKRWRSWISYGWQQQCWLRVLRRHQWNWRGSTKTGGVVRSFFSQSLKSIEADDSFWIFPDHSAKKIDILISYECNSSSPLTFVEIRLHAIVILLQYLLVMFFACSTFFSRTALNKGYQSALEWNYVNKKPSFFTCQ